MASHRIGVLPALRIAIRILSPRSISLFQLGQDLARHRARAASINRAASHKPLEKTAKTDYRIEALVVPLSDTIEP
jgi:hypothetical protein